MELHAPFFISARLLPAVKVGSAIISLEHLRNTTEGRDAYKYYIDTPDFEHEGNDLKTGCQGGGYNEAMKSLLSCLSAAAESYAYTMRGGESENDDIFSPKVMEWAYQNSDEISMLSIDLEEFGDLIKY